MQACKYAEAAYEWNPDSVQAVCTKARVYYHDEYFLAAVILLTTPTEILKESARIKNCRNTLMNIIGAVCKGKRQIRLVENVSGKVDPTSMLLLKELKATHLLKGVTNRRLLLADVDREITFSDFCLMPTPSDAIVAYQRKAIKLARVLTVKPPCYIDCRDVDAVTLLARRGTHLAGDDIHPCPKLVIGSWNMRAAYAFHDINTPKFLSTKLINLAKIARGEGMVLIALQECPSRNISETMMASLRTNHFFSSWSYCEALSSSDEAAGFLYDSSVLEIVTQPVAYSNIDANVAGGNNTEVFRRPPVLAIFKAAAVDLEKANSAAQRIGLLVVCNVHLKSSKGGGPNLPRADLKLLASKSIESWIDGLLKKAISREKHIASAGQCVLIIGDFNLAGKYRSQEVGQFELNAEDMLDHVKATHPGEAWNGLEKLYKRLLSASDTTNFGLPVTKASYAYDNALVRFSDDSDSNSKLAKAYVCDIADHCKEMLRDIGVIRNMRGPNLERPKDWENFVFKEADAMLKHMRDRIFTAWSDHKPIVVHL